MGSSVYINDALSDAGAFGRPGNMPHQRQPEWDGCTQPAAGDDVAVCAHLVSCQDGAGAFFFHRWIACGAPPLQKPPFAQKAGRGADSCHPLSLAGKGQRSLLYKRAARKVLRAPQPAGQHHHAVFLQR